jgi:hypothetical protein
MYKNALSYFDKKTKNKDKQKDKIKSRCRIIIQIQAVLVFPRLYCRLLRRPSANRPASIAVASFAKAQQRRRQAPPLAHISNNWAGEEVVEARVEALHRLQSLMVEDIQL